MNAYRYWTTVEKLIDDALDLDPDLRPLFLESKCKNNPELLNEALDYLWCIEKAEKENFLDREKDLISSFISHYLNSDFKKTINDLTEEFK